MFAKFLPIFAFVKISLEFVDFRADFDRIFTNLVESKKIVAENYEIL